MDRNTEYESETMLRDFAVTVIRGNKKKLLGACEMKNL